MSNLLLNQNSNFLLLLAAFMQQQQQQQQQQQNQIQAQQRDHSIRLLESLFAINPEPGEEAIELIAQRVESSAHEVANWFHLRREQALTDRQAAAELERLNPNLLASLADHLANRLPACSAGQQQSSRVSNGNANSLRPEASRITPAAAAAAATARALALAAQQHQQQQQQQSQFNQNSTNASFLSPNSNLNQSQQYEDLLAINNSTTTNNNNNNTPSALLNHRLDHTNYLLAQHNLRTHSPPSSATSPHLNLMGYSNTGASEHNISNISLQNGSLNNNNYTTANNNNTNACPSSTLLSKLNAVTSRQGAHLLTSELDPNMIDLLEALYAINDNPEPSAIEMISKRVNVTIDAIADWFDKKRLKLNPYAGPRSPPANKKREGGRVVTFSEYQRSLLEAIFNENNYLHPQEYEELSKLIQVPSRNIKIWFKNRRSKQRLSRPPGSGDVTGGGGLGAALSGADMATGGDGLLADDDLGVVVDGTNGT